MIAHYYFGGQRVAMRQVDSWGGDVVYYLLGDHLGTTSVVLCGSQDGCDGVANGGKVAESRHYPYGAVRWSWSADGSGTLPTDYRFTGQRDVGLGLTHMGARFLDVALGRWISADTIVPDFTNPQSLNRYSFVLANPLQLVDVDGHTPIPPWLVKALQAKSSFTPYLRVTEGSKPAPLAPDQDAANRATSVVLTCDTLATSISTIGATMEIGMFGTGLLTEVPGDEMALAQAGIKSYYAVLNPVENAISFIGSYATWEADFAAGNSQISSWPSITIGQDPIVSTGALFIGNQNVVPLEGVTDSILNILLMLYDVSRAAGEMPTYFEYRCDDYGACYIMVYTNPSSEQPEQSEE